MSEGDTQFEKLPSADALMALGLAQHLMSTDAFNAGFSHLRLKISSPDEYVSWQAALDNDNVKITIDNIATAGSIQAEGAGRTAIGNVSQRMEELLQALNVSGSTTTHGLDGHGKESPNQIVLTIPVESVVNAYKMQASHETPWRDKINFHGHQTQKQ